MAVTLIAVIAVAVFLVVRTSKDSDEQITTVELERQPESKPADEPISIRDIDLYNRSYDIDCDGNGIRAIEVRNGSWTAPAGPEHGALNDIAAVYGDVDGDGIENVIVNINCSVGNGSNNWTTSVVLRPVIGGAEPIGQPIPASTKLIDGRLIGEVVVYGDHDPMCCPSQVEQSEWTLHDGGWSQENRRFLPIEEAVTWGD